MVETTQLAAGVTLIGAGFVADLYLRSFAIHPEVPIHGVWDRDPVRLEAFTSHWGLPRFSSLAEALAETPEQGLVLNLTNPSSHAEVSREAIAAGRHVWSEKPMVLDFTEASELAALAEAAGVQLASAPASVLSAAAQAFLRAVRREIAGTPRLVYAELDDGFVPQAPVKDWTSESGAPWPFEDEFRTGCTLEHAGYWLSWLIAAFGPVAEVVTSANELLPEKVGVRAGTPDSAVATLRFTSGVVARTTFSIIAPHDHRLRLVGDKGILEVPAAWDNAAVPRFRPRLRIRRRILESPIGRRLPIKGNTHPMVSRKGAAAMNFALGPIEVLESISSGKASRLSGDYALHLTEVTLACQQTGVHTMTTSCQVMEPMPWAR